MTNAPPSSVRIGPFSYSISPMTPMEATKHGLFGWHHWPSLDIRYRDDVSPQQIAHVVFHEILHGVWYTHDINGDEKDRDVEEEYVGRLATALCDLIRDNPKMVAWISQTLAGDGETFLQTATDTSPTSVSITVKDVMSREERMEEALRLRERTVDVNGKPTLWA